MLEDLFATARSASQPHVSPELLARVLTDAETHQPDAGGFEAVEVRNTGRWQQFISAIGGWPSLTGLAAATVAGVWIGFSLPDAMLTNGLSGLVTQDAEYYLTYLSAGDFVDYEEM